jgi:hypothetical protein
MTWMVIFFVQLLLLLSIYIYFLRSVYISLSIVLGCLQRISTHTWVMLICAIGIPKGWADTCHTIYIACLLIMDPLGLYIWITVGRFIFLLKMNLLLMNSLTEILQLLSKPQLETLLKFFPVPAYRNLTLQCLTEVCSIF